MSRAEFVLQSPFEPAGDQPKAIAELTALPGIVLATILLLLKFVLPVVAPDKLEIGVFGGLLASVAILLWWLLASRAPWRQCCRACS